MQHILPLKSKVRVEVVVKHLVFMVKPRVSGKEMHNVNECSQKYSCTNMWVFVSV